MKRKLAATALAAAAATGVGVATAVPATAAAQSPAAAVTTAPAAPRCLVTYLALPFLGGWGNVFDWAARTGRNTCW